MRRPEQDGPARRLERAAALLEKADAHVLEEGGGYAVRTSPDRRRRPAMMLDAGDFAAPCRETPLTPRSGGGWRLARSATPARPAPDLAGRPGRIDGERVVVEDGAAVTLRANLGESPIAWLARRKDAGGRPWLTAAEAAAGERLTRDFERSGVIGRLTMDWDAAPRGRTPRGPPADPAARNRAAKERVQAALEEAGPGLRDILERVCLAGLSLEAAERELKLPRRSGKTVLKLALQRLAAFYGMR